MNTVGALPTRPAQRWELDQFLSLSNLNQNPKCAGEDAGEIL